MNENDKKTAEVASDIIEKFDEAWRNEDFEAMTRIMDAASGSPNIPFRIELMRQLDEVMQCAC